MELNRANLEAMQATPPPIVSGHRHSASVASSGSLDVMSDHEARAMRALKKVWQLLHVLLQACASSLLCALKRTVFVHDAQWSCSFQQYLALLQDTSGHQGMTASLAVMAGLSLELQVSTMRLDDKCGHVMTCMS